MSITKQEKICNKIKMGYQTIKGVTFKFKDSAAPAVEFKKFDKGKKMGEKLFKDNFFFFFLKQPRLIIEGAVRKECDKVKKDDSPKWIDCPGKKRKRSSVTNSCYKILHDLAKKELESTAFILRLLAKSMIDITKTQGADDGKTITLIYTGNRDFSDLTGKWENDINLFNIEPQKKK